MDVDGLDLATDLHQQIGGMLQQQRHHLLAGGSLALCGASSGQRADENGREDAYDGLARGGAMVGRICEDEEMPNGENR